MSNQELENEWFKIKNQFIIEDNLTEDDLEDESIENEINRDTDEHFKEIYGDYLYNLIK